MTMRASLCRDSPSHFPCVCPCGTTLSISFVDYYTYLLECTQTRSHHRFPSSARCVSVTAICDAIVSAMHKDRM